MYFFIRTKIRRLLLDLLSEFSKPNPGIHILNGHYLSLNEQKSKDVFQMQLDALRKKGVEFVDFNIATELIEKREIPKNKILVAFSFDDGFEECYTKIRPVLNNYGIKACFFINPNFIGGDEEYKLNFKKHIVYTNKPPMSLEQIKNLKNDGHFIGAHTMDHFKLDSNDNDTLEYQIAGSKKYIEEKLGEKCEYFAFPYGQLNHISKLGIEVALNHFKYVFSQSNYTSYFSFDGRIINRRHFECDWPYKHVLYFLKRKTL